MRDTQGDVARLERLWEDHYGAVLAYGRRRASEDVAAEVAAEVFAVAWRRLVDVPSEPRAWLLGVARRTLANHRRAEGRRRALVDRLQGERPPRAESEPEDADAERVMRALGSLSVKEREALLLIAWDGLGHDEAAAVCGCTQVAFRVRLHRARRRFADQLGPHMGSPGDGRLEPATDKEGPR